MAEISEDNWRDNHEGIRMSLAYFQRRRMYVCSRYPYKRAWLLHAELPAGGLGKCIETFPYCHDCAKPCQKP